MTEELEIQKDQADQMSGITIETLEVKGAPFDEPFPPDQEDDVNDSPQSVFSGVGATSFAIGEPAAVPEEEAVAVVIPPGFQVARHLEGTPSQEPGEPGEWIAVWHSHRMTDEADLQASTPSVPDATGDSAPAPTPVHLEVKVPAKYEMGFQAGWRAAFDHLKPIIAKYLPNAVVGTDIARLIADIAVVAEG